jgi:hypothetical protein
VNAAIAFLIYQVNNISIVVYPFSLGCFPEKLVDVALCKDSLPDDDFTDLERFLFISAWRMMNA